MTVAECAVEAATALVRAGHPPGASRRDVGVLIRHILGWDSARLLTHQRNQAPPSLAAALAPLVERRAAGEPVAYLTGEREFYGRAFTVTPDVLIPRPETELVVDVACRFIDARDGKRSILAVDVGTGSGCLAVTLAAERAQTVVAATDVSIRALEVAAGNAARHGVTRRLTFRHQSLIGDAMAAVDLVISNPPYVAETDAASLMRDVRDYEPALALFGGADGLEVIRRLIPEAFAALRPGGALVMEIGAGQFNAVNRLLRQTGFEPAVPHPDLAGVLRVVSAERPGLSV